jgi:CHAT domain-containing protein
MTAASLVEQLLQHADEESRRAFLERHGELLTLDVFQTLKSRADGLALEAPRRALDIAEAAVWAASFAVTPLAEAMAVWARGNAYLCLGDYRRALDNYSRAADLYQDCESEDDCLTLARLQTNIVGVLKNLGRYADALTLAETARTTLQPWAESRYMATLEMNVGSVYRLLGQYPEALAAYERGHSLFATLGNTVQVARMDVNRARVLVCMDRFREAEALLYEAGQMLTAQGKALPAARATLNRATLLSRQGRHRKALAAYCEARRAFASLENMTDVAVTDLYLTYDYLALNLLPEALDLATTAGDALQAQGMPRYVALAMANKARAARKLGRHTEALQALEEARSNFVEREAWLEVARLDVERAVCHYERGDPAAAATLAEEVAQSLHAREVPLQAAQADLVLADSRLALGDIERSAARYAQALTALRVFPALAWQAHAGLGRVAEARQQWRPALGHYRDAIACIEASEATLGLAELRAGFLEDKLTVYRRAVRVALIVGDTETAFEFAAQSKTGVWRDYLAHREEDTVTAELAALRRRWHWLYNQLTRSDDAADASSYGALEPKRGDHTRQSRWGDLRHLERRLRQARRKRAAALPRQPKATLSIAQTRVPAKSVLLDYYCTDEMISAFVVDRDATHTYEALAPRIPVERLINRWRFNLASVRLHLLEGRSAVSLVDQAHEVLASLYQHLVAPLGDALEEHTTVWIAPHHALWWVPFAALYDGARYLVERYPLLCLPGFSAAVSLRPLSMAGLIDNPLVLGYSDGGRLTHAVREARAVAAALNCERQLLECEATIAHLHRDAPSSTLLHLATHGLFRTDAPRFSVLHLADGALTAEALESWHLPQAELVTLSACETGISQNWGSDLLGLARSFWRAGARRLLVSQWAVDDVSTAELMARFYTRVRAGSPLAAALQVAQVAAMAKYRHPFYWAGFVLMGRL